MAALGTVTAGPGATSSQNATNMILAPELGRDVGCVSVKWWFVCPRQRLLECAKGPRARFVGGARPVRP